MRDNIDVLTDALLAAKKNAEQPKIKKSKQIMLLPPWKRGAGI